jgi:hypothetical protein
MIFFFFFFDMFTQGKGEGGLCFIKRGLQPIDLPLGDGTNCFHKDQDGTSVKISSKT